MTNHKNGPFEDSEPVPEYWNRVREYLDEAEHGGEVPTTFDEFIDDLKIWESVYPTLGPNQTLSRFD
jgi:hypothetical protein